MYDNECNYNSSIKFHLILNNDEVIMYIHLLKRYIIKKILEFDYEILSRKIQMVLSNEFEVGKSTVKLVAKGEKNVEFSSRE